MSSILKEPYQISVWEDELIPEIVEYYKKTEEGKIETITSEEYNSLLSDEEKQQYTQKIIREHFEESRGLIIGANDMDSPYAAVNSSLKTNVNGSANLTFTMYYKVFDPDVMDFVINPLAAAVLNERKIKLHFRGKWYDMVIKNCVEDSTAYSFTYTCSDIYINELSKNGFKVELDTELENNQGTVTKVGETILEGTDWHVAPIEEEAPKGYKGPYSDVIVQTNIEPIYQGILNQTITVEPVNDFTPDEYADMSNQSGYIINEETGKKTKTSFTIPKGEVVFMFYSDITKNAEQPQILYRNGVKLPEDLTDKEKLSAALQKVYARDVNEDIITNAYNYRVISPEVLYVDKASSYDVPNIFYLENDSSFEICDWARGEKVIRSTKTGYDPDLDQFITVYKKYNEETKSYDYYYGYTTLDSISSDLVMNYLANSDNFIGIDTGWIFDGTPTTMDDAGDGTTVTGTNPNSEDATFTGQIYLLNQEGFSYDAANEGGAESVLIMKLEDGGQDKDGTPHYYRDNNGDFYKITEVVAKNDGTKDTETKVEYIKLSSPKAESYEAQIAAEYERLRTKGDERFASMSDDELQRTIDGALRNARYSTRIRRAVNTGIAANRKQIENFSESEEYIFAVSLGQYKEGESVPEYGHEIKYGAKTPTELYTFEDIDDSEAILKKVREEAYTQAVAEIKNHPTRYLNTDEYGNITDEIYLKVYNDYLAEKEAEYTAIYLDDFGLLKNLMHGDTIDKNERGGKKFRNIFKNNLLSDGSYIDKNGEIKFEEDSSERFVNKTISLLNDCKNFDTKQIYVKEVEEPFATIVVNGKEVIITRKIFTIITQKEYDDITDENLKKEYTEKTLSFAQQLYEGLKTAFFNYGWAPAELAKQKAEADTNSFEWFFIENSWEQSGNDGTFPEYVEDSLMFTDESEINCFCDMLYVELIKTIYDRYIITDFDTNQDGTPDDVSTMVIIPTQGEIMQIVDDVFEDLVDRVGLIGALKAAYEYKKPSILNSKGGDKYQQHRARWEKDGHEVALYAAFHSEPFASKYSYGTPELDEDGKVVQDDKTTEKNEFGGKDEVEYLTEIEKLRIEAKKELDEKSSPAYVGTADYYKELDGIYQNIQTEYDNSKQWEEYTETEHICGWGFTSLYLKYKEAKFNEAAQVATFTISREEYSLATGEGDTVDVAQVVIPTQNEDGSWDINKIYSSSSKDAEYIAYEDNENGYYIFDKKIQKVRLFNPKTDGEKATYLPIKDNENGLYVYDTGKEVYRKYRPWSSKECRDPITKELLSQNEGGVRGDKIYHEMAWFDGHLGDYEEIPTRYNMIRTYEDEEDRNYLSEDTKFIWNVVTKPNAWDKFKEFFDFDWDLFADNVEEPFERIYKAGYQLDHFVEEEDGAYVRMDGGTNKLEEFNTRVKAFFEGLGDLGNKVVNFNSNWINYDSTEIQNVGNTTYSLNPRGTGFIGAIIQWGHSLEEKYIVPIVDFTEETFEKINNWVQSENAEIKEKYENFIKSTFMTVFSVIIKPLATMCGKELGDIGLPKINKSTNESEHFENQPYYIDYNGISLPNLENGDALVNMLNGGLWTRANNATTINNEQQITTYTVKNVEGANINAAAGVQYVKYRWWNWRHWGRKRYNLKEKLCVPVKSGSDEEYKVYNNIHDAVSKNYSVVKKEELPKGKTVAFYLKDKTIAYRSLQDTDYSPYTYAMIYDDEVVKNHYVLEDNYNYFRPYQKGDDTLQFRGWLPQKWCQTYEPVISQEQELNTIIYLGYDKYGVFQTYLTKEQYEQQLSLAVEKRTYPILKEANYNTAWMKVNSIFIPFDQRVYNAGKRHFRRVRSTSNYSSFTDWDLDNLFTYCNGEYMSLREYYEKNTKISHLDYNGLKVYFTPHYKYNPEHFSLEVNQEPYDEYLGLQIKTEPEGYFDTTVLNNTIIEEEVKERWGYWKIGVNKGCSLTDDLLSSIGIVFEKATDSERPVDKNGNDEDFAFLGMQLFKYIPYRSNKRKEEISIVESGTLTFTKTIDTGYWDLVPSGEKLKELKEDIVLPEVKDEIPIDANLELAAKEFFEYLSEGIEKTEYIVSYLDAHEGDNTQEFIFEYILEKVSLTEERRPIIPDEAPDARDLTLTEYYIYDPEREENDKPETAIFDYKGQYPEEAGYEVVYDELCQKIRSIKGKEQNYFKLLQDCCDTFDCWMEVIVDHDPETGRVEYEERKVYTKISDEVDPQQYFDVLPEGEEETDYTVEYMIVPKKTIRFKRFVGKENWSGFKYGVNLKHVKRTLDSNQIATRIIVKPNKNEFATDGFCTIQRADENFIKENFIYDFSYYINKKMLDYGQVLQDLYTDVGSNLGYYRKLGRLNKENDQLIIDIASVIVELDKVNADYETAVLGRDAANEEIQKLMQILASNYDTYGNIQFVPWEYNRAKEYEQKTSTTAPERPNVQIVDAEGKTYTVNIPKTTTELEYPKYNETLRTYFDQMDTYMRSHINFSKQVEEFGKRKQELEEKRDKLLALEQEIIAKKKELNKIFFIKYARFIQEGSWVDEKYMDDNLYYLDSLAVLRNSCSPKVTYDIGVIDLYAAVEFEEDRPVLEFELGDRTYVEDVEFFGYAKNDKPYQEQIVISEKIYMLDDVSQNQIKVKNYSTQFDNLFQRAAAATQTLQFNEGSYGRASTILNSDGTINHNVLQQSVSNANLILANSLNENVLWDNTGITVTSYSQRSNVIKIVSAGIMLSKDGGNSYLTAITGDGVNAAIITGGMLNVDKLMIGASSTPNFLWNRAGISAFKTSDEGIDYSTFVRLDQYGIYGIKDWSKNDIPIDKMTINDTFEPLKLADITNNNNAIFGLTWDGFFLNTVTEQGRGRVTIGTNQDFRMSVFDEDIGWQDRVIIGSMSDILTGEKTYGFRLVNADGEIVMDTNLRGELYLKRKLRISNFANETSYNPGLSYDENGNIQYNPEQVYSSNTDDRVTLGIVDIYERTGEGTFAPAEPEGVYKSSQYLTKVLSIKVNDIIGNEWFVDDPESLGLISSNETFAIFDNGNLYAKNAWIEGNIRANEGYIGGIDILNGSLVQRDRKFEINQDGTAIFSNAIISGTLKTTVFEYDQVQTIAGSMLIRPGIYVKPQTLFIQKINDEYIEISKERYDELPDIDKFGYIIFISANGLPEEFRVQDETNKYISIGFYENVDFDQNNGLDSTLQIYRILNTSQNNILKDRDSDNTVYILYEEELYNNIINEDEVFLSYWGTNVDKVTCLGINAMSNNQGAGFLPQESFSLVELSFNNTNGSNTIDRNIKAVFGKITDIILKDYNKNDPVYNSFINTYGLYCDNVYVQGSMISKNENFEAGISTKGIYSREVMDTEENILNKYKIILWAKNNNEHTFYVDETGFLYANNGYFKGEIESSRIKTSTIIGDENNEKSDQFGLTFIGNTLTKAMIFKQSENGPTYFSLESNKTLFNNDFYLGGRQINIGAQSINSKNFGSLVMEDLGVGLFSISEEATKVEQFLINFVPNYNTNSVVLSYQNEKVLDINQDGIKYLVDQFLGKYVRVRSVSQTIQQEEAMIVQGIGCDFYVDN